MTRAAECDIKLCGDVRRRWFEGVSTFYEGGEAQPLRQGKVI